jgi:hypothetical protein
MKHAANVIVDTGSSSVPVCCDYEGRESTIVTTARPPSDTRDKQTARRNSSINEFATHQFFACLLIHSHRTH